MEEPREIDRMSEALDPRLMAIGLVAMFALLVDLSHPVPRDGLLEPAWTLAVYAVIPLALAVLVGGGRCWRSAGPAGLGLAVTVAMVATRAWALPEGWLDHRPSLLISWVAAGVALVAAGAILGRVDLSRWGVALGDWRWWLPRFGALMALIVPAIAIAASVSPELLDYYPEYEPARHSAAALFWYQIGNGVYMLGWEYFFRGFLTFSVATRAGAAVAVLLQALPFLVLHADKPELEMAASYFGAVLLAAFCLRARTFLPAVFLHWGINVAMEVAGFLHIHK